MNARTRVPVVAIVLQGVAASVIASRGTFAQIVDYVTSVDFIFFGLTGLALLIFRHRDSALRPTFVVPGGVLTTAFFILACWSVVVATVLNKPKDSLIGYAILAAGVPACLYWQRKNRMASA